MRGRKPTYKYSEELANHIFGLIVEGRSIAQACKVIGISRWLTDKWRMQYPHFNELIEDARDMKCHFYRDVILEPLLSRLHWRYQVGLWQPRGRKIGRLFWLAKCSSRRNFGKKRQHLGWMLDTGISTTTYHPRRKRKYTIVENTPRFDSSMVPGFEQNCGIDDPCDCD